MSGQIQFDVAIPPLTLGLMMIGWLITMILVTGLVALIECVVLTLLKWGFFSKSLRVALIMNLITTLAGLLFIDLVPLGWSGIAIAFFVSFLVESLILARYKPDKLAFNFLAGFIANLASYLLIIAPAYWMR